jgi:hypothetical protein
MIPLLAAAALLFIYAAGQKPSEGVLNVPKEITAELSAAIQAELKKLYADPALSAQYSKIQTLLMSPASNPVELYGYAIALMQKYPAIATALSTRFGQVTKRVVGASGTEWNTWSPGPRADGMIPVDVLYGATPVLSYAQKGEDKSTRKLIGITLDSTKYLNTSTMQQIVFNAKKDFGV